MDYDALVIGGGIAGMESAISLGDMGYKVLLVEKEPSVGGKMILLSKVFPTLDCASCISTPKMALAASHPNIELAVYTEVKGIRRNGAGTFKATITKKPTFVDFAKCTGCQDCEKACSVTVPDQFNAELVSRRAAYIAFPQAVPKKAVIEREGTSPCTFACPAGIKANGYISLSRRGDFDKAFNLILEDAPLVGSLGRACYAPCEPECTRETIGGAPRIKLLKRFIADWYYARHPEPDYGPVAPALERRVAVAGSGPAGLTAAYFLARKGYRVTVLEAGERAGGMLRTGLPSYRLPKDVVDRDIKNVTALGVEIKTGTRVDSVGGLLKQGFDAVFLSVGAAVPKALGVTGEEFDGVTSAIDFLARVNRGEKIDLAGKTALVVGGGNAAIDAARTARRLGAADVRIVYRRARADMPASGREVEDALREGVRIVEMRTPTRVVERDGRAVGLETIGTKKVFDRAGGYSLEKRKRTEKILRADVILVAIGQEPATPRLGADGVSLGRDGTISVDRETLMTDRAGVFAGGDAVQGPATIAEAVGQGKRAAFHIDRWLRGEQARVVFNDMLPAVEKETVLARQAAFPSIPVEEKELPPGVRLGDMSEVQLPLTEEAARASAANCLNCAICSECRECVKVCPAHAVDLEMRAEEREIEVGAVIVSTGFKLFPAELMERYGFGKFKNVITSMQMDRLIAPTRPFNHVLRPGDGKVPGNIAYVLCAGSRDRTVDNPICSRVCCMYSMKQAQLLLGALPVADVTLYYIDIRAFGKGYEEFYQQTKGMGVRFVKGKVAKIAEKEGGGLVLRYEDIDGGGTIREAEHDLVVLSVGFIPNPESLRLFDDGSLESDSTFFVREPDEHLSPAKTSIEGVFAAGTSTGPMDIPDTILHSGAAAAQAAAYVERMRRKR
jgi:heterodisulfide reductase subunit A-like polyferredoxin